jgi:uncharacterized membrane protein
VLASITAYSISVWIHVSAVVVGFGATFAEAVTFPVAMKLDPRHLPYVHRLGVFINQRLATPALVVIILTGIYQTADGDWDFGSFWISATFLIALVLGGLMGAYFIPTDRKLADQVAAEIAAAPDGPFTPSADYQAKARREGVFGAVAGILVILAVFLMVTKPGA